MDLNSWRLTAVYGPCNDQDRVLFLEELKACRDMSPNPWLLCGDFNMIYRERDKNNGRLDRRCMRRFRAFLDMVLLQEIELRNKRFSWSNERDNPTLVLLDRVFADVGWLGAFPRHSLKALSMDCSDHCPLLLTLSAFEGGKRRFRFESVWTKFLEFQEVVQRSWATPVPRADPFQVLDQKFRSLAMELKRWSNSKIGSINLQLAMTREVILRFDEEQEHRHLAPWEAALRRALKMKVLGLASLACHRTRKGRIESLHVEGAQLVTDAAMAEVLYDHYNALLGTNFVRSRRFDLHVIGMPFLDLACLESLFSEEEVWSVIQGLPNEKAPGPDGFTGLFYKVAWPTIKGDIMNAFNAFWAQDACSLHHVNEAFLMLLKKKEAPQEIKDFRPISLVHSFGKLITKCMAARLAPVLDRLVLKNQSTFIRGRSIHDNFHEVIWACQEIYRRRQSCVLLKVDIAKAFDSVAWVFLLEVLQHAGFGRRWCNWVSNVLSSSSTKILLNDRPGRRICHARGLR
jgi:hypothetical protein